MLTGAGKVFCAGGDFSQMTGGADGSKLPLRGDYKDLLLALWRTTKPVIARVNGHALGGGLGLVAASTFAIASTEAKLGTPEINVGLFPFMIMAVLERVMPRRRLVEMMLSGERLSAEQAAAAGLINAAVAPAELDGEVLRIAEMIASKSASTIRLGLEALRDTEELALEDRLPILSDRLGQCLTTDDAREGLMAFLERRQPKWAGR
jgi:enoyl-CoA hydratase/carnithine racemase